MKVYFIFDVKDEFKNLYKDRTNSLFNILRSIYNLSFEEVEYGYTLLRQIVKPIKKDDIDRDIYVKLHKEYPYSKRNGIHYYNQLYKNEISRLTVKKTYMKLEVEQNDSSFFNILRNFSSNYFVCDFKNRDFFFV